MRNVTWLASCFLLTLLQGCPDEIPVDSTAQHSASGFVERDGVSLPYIREGNGEPAVVVGTSIFYSRAFSMALRDHLDLIFADGRHFVPSYEPGESELASLTLETWVDDVEALRQSLGIDQWIVIGQSMQAQIALAYARKYPAAVSRLVLIAGVPYRRDADYRQTSQEFWETQASDNRKAQHEINIEGLEEKLAATPRDRRFVVSYIANAARWWADPTYDSTPLWEGVLTSPSLGKLAQSLLERTEVENILDHPDFPTLVIAGKLDYSVPYIFWEELVGNNPEITYVLMEQDSHNPYAESPDRFDPILLDWLGL